MQINVVSGGSPALFNAMLFPENPPETQQWLHEQWNRTSGMLTDMGRAFAEKAEETWKRVYDPFLMQKVRAITRKVNTLTHPNRITNLNTLEAVREAKPVMARYIMAMPEIRKLYHKQLCDGYSDIYVDSEPGLVGENHYDYRRVMNSIVTETKDKHGEETWKATKYIEDLVEGDRELDFDEQVIVLDTWDIVKAAIIAKADPTDIFGGKLEI